jgi:hypothetical protein
MSRDRGFALVVAMMSLIAATALGAALTLTTSTEALIAGNYRAAAEGMYAAEAALDRAADELAVLEGWNPVLDGTTRSRFVDGPPTGVRTLSDGATIDLETTVNLANCGRLTPCTAADMDAVSAERPHGPNNPRWRLYAHCPLVDLVPSATVDVSFYTLVLVGDDGEENDGNPVVDGGPPLVPAPSNPGRGIVLIRAFAFGPAGAQKVIQSAVARAVRTVSWSEIR